MRQDLADEDDCNARRFLSARERIPMAQQSRNSLVSGLSTFTAVLAAIVSTARASGAYEPTRESISTQPVPEVVS